MRGNIHSLPWYEPNLGCFASFFWPYMKKPSPSFLKGTAAWPPTSRWKKNASSNINVNNVKWINGIVFCNLVIEMEPGMG